MATSDSYGSTPGDLREESFGQLLKDLSADTSHLVKQEIALARVELTQTARQMGRGAGMLAGAGVVALVALGTLSAFLVVLLDLAMPLWAAALIITVLWALVAAVLAASGRSELQKSTPAAPEQTIETMKENVQWAKHPTRSART